MPARGDHAPPARRPEGHLTPLYWRSMARTPVREGSPEAGLAARILRARNWNPLKLLDGGDHIELRRFAGPARHTELLTRPLRVAHVTDIHVGRITPMAVQHAAVDLVNAQQPDLVAITGDFVCHSQLYLDALAELIARYHAPVLCVLGNHDHWSGAAEVRRTLTRAGAQLLDNQHTTLTLHNQQLQVMQTNRFVETFVEAVTKWQRSLGLIDSTLVRWVAVQKQWAALHPIFIQSDDIRHQLPADAANFAGGSILSASCRIFSSTSGFCAGITFPAVSTGASVAVGCSARAR